MKNRMSCSVMAGFGLLVLYCFWMVNDWFAQQGVVYLLTATAKPATAFEAAVSSDSPRIVDTPRPSDTQPAGGPSLIQLIESGINAKQTEDVFSSTGTAQALYTNQINAGLTEEAIQYARQATEQEGRRQSEAATQQALVYEGLTATAGEEDRQLQRMIIELTARASDAQSTSTVQAAMTETAEALQKKTEDVAMTQTEYAPTALAVLRKSQNEQLTSTAWALFWLLLPISLLVLAIVIALRFTWHKTELTPIRADTTGKYPLIVRNGKIVNGNLQTQPVMNTEKPAPDPSQIEIEVKQGEQHIDAVRALPRTMQPAQLPSAGNGQGFVMLSENALPPERLMPDPGVSGVIDGDWSKT